MPRTARLSASELVQIFKIQERISDAPNYLRKYHQVSDIVTEIVTLTYSHCFDVAKVQVKTVPISILMERKYVCISLLMGARERSLQR